jgi:hypothetical protein
MRDAVLENKLQLFLKLRPPASRLLFDIDIRRLTPESQRVSLAAHSKPFPWCLILALLAFLRQVR